MKDHLLQEAFDDHLCLELPVSGSYSSFHALPLIRPIGNNLIAQFHYHLSPEQGTCLCGSLQFPQGLEHQLTSTGSTLK